MATHRSPARSTARMQTEARRNRRVATTGTSPSRHAGSAHEVATRVLAETLAALILFLALLMSLRTILAP